MGLLSRIKRLIKAETHQEENPEQVISAYIESASERLRELTVVAARAESEWLTARDRMNRYREDEAACRRHAETAAKAGDGETARKRLEQAHHARHALEQLEHDSSGLEANVKTMKESLEQLSRKITKANALREQYQLRFRSAAARHAAAKALNQDFRTDELDDAVFLAEAKAELARSRLD